ncbi:hypothetical protein TAMA11512_00450 [Selenomonas sp. TAMA-11512]|uniref:ArnT family glycosyltransferase n=1 Tax=Selenomonas sp. TAMA-11512 TaxID=3095337 RepID=UPI00309288A4|nr:hypothetical protein TAMA11512_00450 [Selenomonas sp. TAMA-11512]
MIKEKQSEKKIAAIIAAFFLLYLFGNADIAITDPVESNYTEAAIEMLAAGDWISPRIYGNYWFDKPSLFLWELLAAYSVFGVSDFAARFFSAVFAAASLGLTYFFARRIYDARTGFYAVGILGTSFLFWLISKTVITDMTLFFFFNGVLAAFYLAYRERKRGFYVAGFACAALAVLTKGPIGFLLPGLVMTLFILYRRDWAEIPRMQWGKGLVLFALIAGSWYTAMIAIHGETFINLFLGVHNVLRATVSEHPRWDVPYYYAVIFLLGFFPWSIAAIGALIGVIREKGKRLLRDLDERTVYLLLWFFSVNVFYQLMATKYTTYTLPAMLPIAVLTARYMLHHARIFHIAVPLLFVGYAALTQLVVIPYTSNGGFSGKPFAQAVEGRLQDDDLLVSYGVYSASMVYYTGHPMWNLETREKLIEIMADDSSWQAVYVMPVMAIEDLPRDHDTYLMLKKKLKNPLFPPGLDESEWELLRAVPDEKGMLLYYRKGK